MYKTRDHRITHFCNQKIYHFISNWLSLAEFTLNKPTKCKYGDKQNQYGTNHRQVHIASKHESVAARTFNAKQSTDITSVYFLNVLATHHGKIMDHYSLMYI